MTGSHGLIGSALDPRLRADGHRVVRLVRGEPEGCRRRALGSRPQAPSTPPGLEGVDAVVHLAGAGHRRQEVDARAQAADPREPHAGHRPPRPHAGRAHAPARSAGLGLGGGVLRQPRRRGAHRGCAPGRRLPRPGRAWPGRPRPRRPARPGSGWSPSAPVSCSPPTAGRSSACSCPSSSVWAVGSAPGSST